MALARLGILIGRRGRGSNMVAIAEACATGSIPAEVVVVVTPALETPAAQAALAMGLHVEVADPELPSYSSDLVQALQGNGCDYICLAGFMRLLPHAVLEAFPDRVVNVHPALLPAFGGKGMYGMHVHRAVIESGAKETGCTIHLVNEHYDEGRILLQRPCVVDSDDTPETLAERVLKVEHEAYPAALAQLIKENGS
jgi:formyltetrahydrofolate-dependent phosphoribosylglycinamide formyltransferase